MADPILWVGKVQRTRRIVVNGEQRTERLPQRGHAGNSDYDNPTIAPGKRWERYIKACGTDARVVLTNAAAHVDDTTPYGMMIRAKARFLGWFPVGSCPRALLYTGELRPNQIVDKSILTQEACKPRSYSVDEPCQHSIAEMEARRAVYSAADAKRCVSMQPDVERLLGAQKEQTKDLINGLRDAVADIATSMRDAATPPAAPAPKGKQS